METESVGWSHSRSHRFDTHDTELQDPRCPVVTAAEATPSGRLPTQRIRVSSIEDLNEVTGPDVDNDRVEARSTISSLLFDVFKLLM